MYIKATDSSVPVIQWIDLNFSEIPTEAFCLCDLEYESERLIEENESTSEREDWEEEQEEETLLAYPFAWGTMWCPKNDSDEVIKALLVCGFVVYRHPVFGVVAGIDGGGYSFYDEHWEPLREYAVAALNTNK